MKNLKYIRNQQHLTQQEMADKLGVKRPTYSRYESGERQPDKELLIKMADILNVTTDYLLGKVEDSQYLDPKLSNIEFALYGEVKELTDEQKQDILDYARFKKEQWKKGKQ